MIELVLILSSTHGHSSEAFGASLFPTIKANQKVLCFFAISNDTNIEEFSTGLTNQLLGTVKKVHNHYCFFDTPPEIHLALRFSLFLFCEQPAAEDIPREGRRGPGLWSSKYVCYILKLRVLGRSSAFLSGWQVDD
jgi:hypothetical protein